MLCFMYSTDYLILNAIIADTNYSGARALGQHPRRCHTANALAAITLQPIGTGPSTLDTRISPMHARPGTG